MKASGLICGLLSALAFFVSEPAHGEKNARAFNRPLLIEYNPTPRYLPEQTTHVRLPDRSWRRPTERVAGRLAMQLTESSPIDNSSINDRHPMTPIESAPLPPTPARRPPEVLDNSVPDSAGLQTGVQSKRPQFRFQSRGPANFKRGYQTMTESLAKRVWDDPKGKRILFEVRGKPGIAVEIPVR